MKSLYIIIALLVLSSSVSIAQSPAVQFYRQNKRLENVRNFKIPGWLIWVGTGIAHDITKNEETKAILKVGRKVKKLRLMIAEDNNPIPASSISNFVSESRRDGFADLIYVRDEGTTVNIMGKIKKNDKFKELVFLVNEDDEFVFFQMKSSIRMKDLQELINVFMDHLPTHDKTRKAEKAKKAKHKKEKLPQA